MIKKVLFFIRNGAVMEQDKVLNLTFLLKLFSIKFAYFFLYTILVFLVFGSGFIQHIEDRFGNTIFIKFLNIVVLAPVLEELIFRNHLKLNFKNLILSFLLALFLFHDNWYLLVVTVYFLFILLMRKRQFPKKKLVLIYFSSLLFAFAHFVQTIDLSNYETIGASLFPLFPHFISGLLLSYLYFRNGIMASMIFHAMWNFFLLTIECLDRS